MKLRRRHRVPCGVHERFLVGRESLRAATELLHRVRRAHPTAGLLEAADLEWWWRAPRATDVLPQLFWVDDLGRPEAAVVATTWDGALTLDPIVMPHAAPAWIEHVIGRGTAHAGTLGLGAWSSRCGRRTPTGAGASPATCSRPAWTS